MGGETDLLTLLRSINPILQPGEFAILTVSLTMREAAELNPIGLFHEEEGLTVILPLPLPDGLTDEDPPRFRQITLAVHSSLEAVGFLAAVTRLLADKAISTNAVAGYFHDHLFVPTDRAEEAVALLHSMGGG